MTLYRSVWRKNIHIAEVYIEKGVVMENPLCRAKKMPIPRRPRPAFEAFAGTLEAALSEASDHMATCSACVEAAKARLKEVK